MAGRVPCGPLFAARGRYGRPRCVLLRVKRQAAEGLPSSAAAAAPSPDGEGWECAIRDPAGALLSAVKCAPAGIVWAVRAA
nr:MAG TPA: hypothetical protein [Caudoviricetes sp.]